MTATKPVHVSFGAAIDEKVSFKKKSALVWSIPKPTVTGLSSSCLALSVSQSVSRKRQSSIRPQ